MARSRTVGRNIHWMREVAWGVPRLVSADAVTSEALSETRTAASSLRQARKVAIAATPTVSRDARPPFSHVIPGFSMVIAM